MSTGIIKGNSSSIDNTLAFPIKPIKIEQSKNIQDEFNSKKQALLLSNENGKITFRRIINN